MGCWFRYTHLGAIYSVNFSADGKWLAASSEYRYISIHDALTGKYRVTIPVQQVQNLQFSKSGERLYFSTDEGIQRWELHKQPELHFTQSGVFSYPYIFFRQVFAFTLKNELPRLAYSVTQGNRGILILDQASDDSWRYTSTLYPEKRVDHVVFSPDGNRVAAWQLFSDEQSDNTSYIQLWTISDGSKPILLRIE